MEKYTRDVILPIFLVLFPLFAFTQSLKTDDGIKHWETDFIAGLNNDGYQFDFGIAYFPLQFIGVKLQLGAAGEIEEFGDWGKDELETHHSYATRFKFTPSLTLRTSKLIHWKSQDAGFFLFAEPGIVNFPFVPTPPFARPKKQSDREVLDTLLKMVERLSLHPPQNSTARVYDNKAIMEPLQIKDQYLKKLRDNGYLAYSRVGDKYWY